MHPQKSLARHALETLFLAAPLTMGLLGNILMRIIDSIMVGQVNYQQLSAYTLGIALFNLPMALAMGITYVLSPKVAQERGEVDALKDAGKDDGPASRLIAQLLRQGLWLGVLAGAGGAVVALLAAQFLHQMGQPADDVALGKPFLQVMGLSLLPMVIYYAMSGFFRGMGNTRIPTYYLFVCFALNLFFNWLLIYGNWGFPRLELLGAAWAYLIAWSLTALAMGLHLFRGAIFRQYAKMAGSSWQPDRVVLKELFRLGFPLGWQELFAYSAFSAIVVMIGWLQNPGEARAAYQIAFSAASISYMIGYGIGMAATIRVGFAKGNGDHAGVLQAGRATLGLVWVITAVLGLGFILGRHDFASLFGIKEPQVLLIASQLMLIGAAYELFDGTQTVALGLLRGCLDVRIPTIVIMVVYCLIQLPLAWWLGVEQGMGVQGFWWAFVVSLGFGGVVLVWRFFRAARQATT